jgi:hypothetical protein
MVSLMPWPHYPQGKISLYPWVGLRAGVDILEEGKKSLFSIPGCKPQIIQPVF